MCRISDFFEGWETGVLRQIKAEWYTDILALFSLTYTSCRKVYTLSVDEE
ncbi:hypothetical protein DAPPUDRAFT_322439 [Daphnia pulex]|uniref:Uncharacterized protein n=1 Tax=Daphnia pulex TaxID=6669 RepID=E9GVZ6_DAPPU|nr:hypothetical protein DAPPUDRAFT_322439 [Daphnia pulex]|eukprot:EFX76262.1 hypothetical protein DAPPUDRAFT_322439 [Daphnia pulex]